MKVIGAKHNVCPGSCVITGAKFPVALVESVPCLRGPYGKGVVGNYTSGHSLNLTVPMDMGCMGNKSVPIQLAHGWFRRLAFFDAKI